jgi:[acyl-carrier-protein] S-malonyltransferase
LKIAFLFPGQGSQYPGMGRELFGSFPSAKQVFEVADAALGFPISQLCFNGPEDELQLTANTQPAILTVSVAAAAVLSEKGVHPDYVAGHSLGECSAVVAAGAMGTRDAVQLVRKRGEYMQEAVPVGQGAMAAILGLQPERAEEICRNAADGEVVAVANLNSPSQVVIAGHASAVARAVDLARQEGARRAIMLKVSAPFHCSLMKSAEDSLAHDLDRIEIDDLSIPLVNNAEARVVRTASDVREGLKRQMTLSVRWEASMRRLLQEGVGLFIEVGPGKVLSGLMRQIAGDAECLHVEDIASLKETLDRVEARGY